jgi:VanZ family protein
VLPRQRIPAIPHLSSLTRPRSTLLSRLQFPGETMTFGMTSVASKDLRESLKTCLPVAAWALLIFILSTSSFSAQETGWWIEPILRWLLPSASLHTIEVMHYAIRKLAHFTEYGILFLLLIRGPMRGHAVLALAACAAYAMLDEGHQMFVPDRTASFYDVALDFSGALFSHFVHSGVAELI